MNLNIEEMLYGYNLENLGINLNDYYVNDFRYRNSWGHLVEQKEFEVFKKPNINVETKIRILDTAIQNIVILENKSKI